MRNTIQYAVLQKDAAGPAPDQLKRAFRTFSNLTDADAMRLAVGARGILMRHLKPEAARAVQTAFQAEGIDVAIVAENDLPQLPEARSLPRLELWPQALTVYDPVGQRAAIPWRDITLVAAGAARHVEFNRTQTEFLRREANAGSNPRLRKDPASGPRIESGPQLLAELLVRPGAIRYEIDAAQFAFKQVINRPGLATEEKFIWLVREICREATHAILNSGARRLREGAETVPAYINRQALTDEIVWLLWQQARSPHSA
jgi:hypothetical protein